MTISRAEWEELSQMKTLMRDVVQRLAVFERVQKRASTSEEGGVPAKTKKLSLPSIKDKLFERPHLVNPRLFHNWWSRGSAKPILRQRAKQELENIGVPTVFLAKLSANILAKVFYSTSSQLLAKGAIDRPTNIFR